MRWHLPESWEGWPWASSRSLPSSVSDGGPQRPQEMPKLFQHVQHIWLKPFPNYAELPLVSDRKIPGDWCYPSRPIYRWKGLATAHPSHTLLRWVVLLCCYPRQKIFLRGRSRDFRGRSRGREYRGHKQHNKWDAFESQSREFHNIEGPDLSL